MSGGPRDYLSWDIECRDPSFGSDSALEWLEGRLSRPVDDAQKWLNDANLRPVLDIGPSACGAVAGRFAWTQGHSLR